MLREILALNTIPHCQAQKNMTEPLGCSRGNVSPRDGKLAPPVSAGKKDCTCAAMVRGRGCRGGDVEATAIVGLQTNSGIGEGLVL